MRSGSAGSGPSPRSPRACSGSRQASVTRARGRRAAARTPCPTSRRRRRRRPSLGRADEVDRDGTPCELEPLAQLVLDPVAVVARDEARVVDEDAEARRARRDLRAVEEVQPLARSRDGAWPRLLSSPSERLSSPASGSAPCASRRAPRPGRAAGRGRGRSSRRRRSPAAAGAGAARAAPRTSSIVDLGRRPTSRARRASSSRPCARRRRRRGPARRCPRDASTRTSATSARSAASSARSSE